MPNTRNIWRNEWVDVPTLPKNLNNFTCSKTRRIPSVFKLHRLQATELRTKQQNRAVKNKRSICKNSETARTSPPYFFPLTLLLSLTKLYTTMKNICELWQAECQHLLTEMASDVIGRKARVFSWKYYILAGFLNREAVTNRNFKEMLYTGRNCRKRGRFFLSYYHRCQFCGHVQSTFGFHASV